MTRARYSLARRVSTAGCSPPLREQETEKQQFETGIEVVGVLSHHAAIVTALGEGTLRVR